MTRKGWKSGIRGFILLTFLFIVRFVMIMSLLYVSAVIFAYLEDPELDPVTKCANEKPSSHNKTTSTSPNSFEYESSIFWDSLQKQHNITLTECDRAAVMENIGDLISGMKQFRLTHKLEHENNNQFEVQKWFYFVIIATTTIGYGDVYPKTQEGKMFYIGFSVIGIILMMYLLKSCGDVFTGINKHINRSVRRFLCSGTKCWEEQTLTMISNTSMFLFYLSLGIWHDSTDGCDGYSMVDIVYFWILSFTTVGFGDVGHSLGYEIEHAYVLTIYRVFGLSLLAAVIDSIMSYLALRRKALRSRTLERHKKFVKMVQSQRSNKRAIKPSEHQKYLMDSADDKTFTEPGNQVLVRTLSSRGARAKPERLRVKGF